MIKTTRFKYKGNNHIVTIDQITEDCKTYRLDNYKITDHNLNDNTKKVTRFTNTSEFVNFHTDLMYKYHLFPMY